MAMTAIVFANMVCNKLNEDQDEEITNQDKSQGELGNESSVWDDEQRIQKALAKSKRSKTWVHQSITHIEDTGKIIADLKAQESAEESARKNQLAKQWVTATMLSQSQAMQDAQEKRGKEEENNRKARLWAESMIRRTDADL